MREEYDWVIEKHFGKIAYGWTGGEEDSHNPEYNWLIEIADGRIVHVWYQDCTSDFGYYSPFYDGITEEAEMDFLAELRDHADYFLSWGHLYEYAMKHLHSAVAFLETKVMTTITFNKYSYEERFWSTFEGLSDSQKTEYWEWLDTNLRYKKP